MSQETVQIQRPEEPNKLPPLVGQAKPLLPKDEKFIINSPETDYSKLKEDSLKLLIRAKEEGFKIKFKQVVSVEGKQVFSYQLSFKDQKYPVGSILNLSGEFSDRIDQIAKVLASHLEHPPLIIRTNLKDVPTRTVDYTNKELYQVYQEAISKNYLIAVNSYNKDNVGYLIYREVLQGKEIISLPIGLPIIIKTGEADFIQKRNEQLLNALQSQLKDPAIEVIKRASGLHPLPIDSYSAPLLYQALKKDNRVVCYLGSEKLGDTFVDRYGIYQGINHIQPLGHIVTLPRNSRNYTAEFYSGLSSALEKQNMPADISQKIYYLKANKIDSSFNVSEKITPELDKLLQEMSKYGFQLWIKEASNSKLVFDFADTGNCDHNLLMPAFTGNDFSFSDPNIFSDYQKRDKQFVEGINRVLKNNEQFKRRKDLSEKLDNLEKKEDILTIVDWSSKAIKCNLCLGDEVRYARALFTILGNEVKDDDKLAELYLVRLALLHNLQKMFNHDPNFLIQLSRNKDDFKKFALGLSEELIAQNKKIADKVILNSETKLIVLLGSEEMFRKEVFENIAKRFGIKGENLKIYKGVEDQTEDNQKELEGFFEEIKNSVSAANQQVVVWTFGHGSEKDVLFAKNKKNSFLVSAEKLLEVASNQENKNVQVDLNNVIYIFDQCHSYELGEKMLSGFSNMKKIFSKDSKQLSPASIITAALRGNVIFTSDSKMHGATTSLAQMLLEAVPKRKTELSYGELARLDVSDNLRVLEPLASKWKYKIPKDYEKKFFTAGDISVFSNEFMETDLLIDKIIKRMKEEGREINIERRRKENPVQIEISQR